MFRAVSNGLLVLIATVSTSVQAANCPDDSNTSTISATSCTVVGTASSITLNFNSGFSDATAISATGGNPGTTVGQQRKRSFIKAASIIADQLQYNVAGDSLVVDANFSALTCSAFSAVLGSAGATTWTGSSGVSGNWESNTFYPIGLWSELNSAGLKLSSGVTSDVTANFNSNLGGVNCLSSSNGWYYGYDAPPANHIGFVTVLLHEMIHGLGFASLVNASSGAKASGFDDIFSDHLYDQVNGPWPNLSNAQRATNATSVNQLLWDGFNVNTQAVGALSTGFHDADASNSFTAGDRIQMYAPSSVSSGSSVSHFTTSASPDELMEPQYTEGQTDLGLSLFLLQDLGWSINRSNTAPTMTAVDQSTLEDTAKVLSVHDWGQDADGDSLTYTITQCATDITCQLSGTTLTLTPADNVNGNVYPITISVNDGIDTVTDTFNLTVDAVNDAPTIEAMTDLSVAVGNTISVSANVADIDSSSLSVSLSANNGALNGSVSGTQITFRPETVGQYTETITVSDGALSASTPVSISVYESITATLEIDGSADVNLADQSTHVISNTAVRLTTQGGSQSHSISLLFNGQNADHLIEMDGNQIEIGMPSADDFDGAYAGIYVLTISDQQFNESTSMTLTRTPKMTLSTTNMLDKDTTQTLSIEGAAVGETFIFTVDHASLLNSQGVSVSSVDAINHPSSFNRTSLTVSPNVVTDSTEGSIHADSNYETVSVTFNVLPSKNRVVHVNSERDLPISGAELNINALTEYGRPDRYETSTNGEATVLLPINGNDIEIQVSAEGYISETVTLKAQQEEAFVTLEQPSQPVVISGSIFAEGEIDFTTLAPVLTLHTTDDQEHDVRVNILSAHQATYSYTHDLSQSELNKLTLKHDMAEDAVVNLQNTTSDSTVNITIVATVTSNDSINTGTDSEPTSNDAVDDAASDTVLSAGSTTAPEPKKVGNSSGAGALHWLLLLCMLSVRKCKRNRREI